MLQREEVETGDGVTAEMVLALVRMTPVRLTRGQFPSAPIAAKQSPKKNLNMKKKQWKKPAATTTTTTTIYLSTYELYLLKTNTVLQKLKKKKNT